MPATVKDRAGRSGVASGVAIETDAGFRVPSIMFVKLVGLAGPRGPGQRIPAQETTGAREMIPQAPD